MPHIPVLLSETLSLLEPSRGGVFVDATLGLGGHSEAMLAEAEKAGVSLRLIGIDQDTEALRQAKERLGENIEYVHGNFAHIADLLKEIGVEEVDGILMDIGVSSYQIDTPERGFSFRTDGPLDMRMNSEISATAAILINKRSERELADIFFYFGEERMSRKIARLIVDRRKKHPFHTTQDLADFVAGIYPANARFKHPHPATRVFQALRIAVNEELEALEEGMEEALSVLKPGGRLGIISFHSLEDRIVKRRFRDAAATEGFTLLTKKPLEASDEESKENPRSRSAKLRGIERDSD